MLLEILTSPQAIEDIKRASYHFQQAVYHKQIEREYKSMLVIDIAKFTTAVTIAIASRINEKLGR